MCGIAGIVRNSRTEKDLDSIRKMIELMAHRGPDDEGIYYDDHICLGHKRLSIIDVHGGHQPMSSPDGRYVLVYNGELYNYLELKERLIKRGRRFVTRSDTEVLLYWVAEHGISGLTDLNGMFAFGFWDREEATLLLARDRLGIKPLYYTEDINALFFSSEIKAMLPLISQKEADLNAIYEFLTFQNILSERTFFKSINMLLPGRWLRWTPSGIESGCYWDITFTQNHACNFQDVVEEYSEVLNNSVARHMIADVPVGSYLSGGFDSSSVATIANGLIDEPIHTFTGAFTDDPYYDERIGSRAVAENIRSVVHEIEITPQDYLRYIGKVIYHLDMPTLGTGALPQYMVSQLVSRDVKVVLTGHGGDEMFGGYQVYKVAMLKETLRGNPKKIISVLWGIKWDEWTRVMYYLLYPLIYPEVGSGLFIMVPRKRRDGFFTRDFLERNNGFEPFESLAKYMNCKDDLPGERLLRLYLKTYLPTLFNQEDKVSMAHSVEARTPLCDNQMVDLSLKFPLGMKLWNNELKAITKAAMKSRLPNVLNTLPKRG
ncbi:MAG: asparagine synthase (glutamine-hydrolyzing), partial [Thermodesulfobacteriota bacterium]|nr:asparagine synthase (glutamine-hydrolyzing) [Thermodesulfobacteriota bacterium]